MTFRALIVILPCAAFCVVTTAYFYQATGRYIFPYRLHPDRLQVLLLGILPIAEIRFRDIADIRKRTFPEAFLLGFNPGVLLLHNRFFGQWLLIYKSRGWRRSVLITPADPDAFIEAVSRYQSSSGH